jgi:hypothetical protein
LCPLCPKSNPAVWKYFLKVHFEDKHKTAPLTKYEHLWKLSNFEVSEMKKFWSKRMNVSAKQTKKSKHPPLVVSEDHRARIPSWWGYYSVSVCAENSHAMTSVMTQRAAMMIQLLRQIAMKMRGTMTKNVKKGQL